jgi:transcriptional antiterminator Rof (Rho-off)
VRFQIAETLGRKQVDRQPARPLVVEHRHEIGIRELGVDDTDARARALDQLGELAARPLGSDDEALGDVRGQRQPGAVRFHQPPQTGDHGGVVGQDERVARLAKTFLREVERRDERRPFVGDQVLSVILHDRIGVRLDCGTRPLERAPKLRELFLAALRARRDERFDGHAATHSRRQLREYLVVVASEERQRDALPSLTDHIEHGVAPLLDGHDEPIGR